MIQRQSLFRIEVIIFPVKLSCTPFSESDARALRISTRVELAFREFHDSSYGAFAGEILFRKEVVEERECGATAVIQLPGDFAGKYIVDAALKLNPGFSG